ncbi:MAG: hypothetical protein ABSH16_14055 [Sedimentisphaerales bacterium]
MVFWIGILIAVAFAASSLKFGLYHAWTMLFNVLIAVYLGVRLGPFVEDFIPSSGQYSVTLAVLATGLASFLVLHGISYVFLIGQFDVTFPPTIGKLGSAIFGFLAGLLIWSFASLLICTTPCSQNKFVKDIGMSCEGFEQMHAQSYLVWWCSAIDKIVGSPDADTGVKQTIAGLLFKPPAKSASLAKRPDANEPNFPAVPIRPAITPAPESNEALPP